MDVRSSTIPLRNFLLLIRPSRNTIWNWGNYAARTKSEMKVGTLVSKLTTSNIPRSFGSARVKPSEVMIATTARDRI